MASGTIEKPQEYLVLQHQLTLLSPITIPSGNLGTILNNVDITTLTYSALDYVPTGRTLIGAVFLWANGSNCVSVDTLVQNGKVTLKVICYASNDQTVSSVRLLCFWQ